MTRVWKVGGKGQRGSLLPVSHSTGGILFVSRKRDTEGVPGPVKGAVGDERNMKGAYEGKRKHNLFTWK